MYGILGLTNFKENLNLRTYENIFNNNAITSSHSSFITIDSKDYNKSIMKYNFQDNTYTIVFSGKLYNTNELINELKQSNFSIDENSDIEVLLKSYIYFGNEVVNKLNGAFAFAIWNESKQELFFARDHFGIKPFYYTLKDDNFIFASYINSIFKFSNISPTIDKNGLSELFGLGPCHTSGNGIFKNIFELKGGHFGIYNENGLSVKRYWKLESKPHNDSFEVTCDKVKSLLEDSIKRQLISDSPLCTFLSGGLDSSIITLYASNYCKENGMPPLNTFSIDYIDNEKNFQKTEFQPNSDKFYIDIMQKKCGSNHKTITLDTPELAESLEDAMLARDFPGMADVDSSLLLFCKNVKKEASVSLTGECADEIFGGYPWFFREDALNSNTFPWSIALKERQELLNPTISKKIDLKDYIDYRYNESLSEVEILDCDSDETAKKRKISHLTLNWFMQTLIDRSDRMGMYNDFEIRVPFCDYKLIQYVWNIPWELKALNGREKGLLRYIMKDLLPSEIIDRKKSPYPKTWNPNYTSKVKQMLTNIINDKNSPINSLLNRNYILEILDTNGKSFTRPWFGQLMTGPQLMAYICQVNMWLEKFKPTIEI